MNQHRTAQAVSQKVVARKRGEHGSVLVASLILVVALVMGAAAFLSHTSTEVIQVKRNNASICAFYHAEAGLSYAQGQLLRGWKLASLRDPFYFIDNDTISTLPADIVVRGGTPEEGRFQVEIIDVSTPYPGARDITVKATGTYHEETRSAIAIFCLEVRPSKVFDYGYFLDHCGWLEGLPESFSIHGNVRAAGAFSFLGSNLHLNGTPESRFIRGEAVYKDSGGIYSGFGILDAPSLNGMGSMEVNQHMYEDLDRDGILDGGEDHNQDTKLTRPDHIALPNISDLSLYEDQARGWNGGAGSSIRIQGAAPGKADLVVSDAVFGDEPEEEGNLVIWGTADNPIVLDGPVVVRGSLIIKGYVKGKGCLYVGQNVYIPDNLRYVNPPMGKPNWNYDDYATPEERHETWLQAVSQWRQENADKDGMGLFARENVVIGDFLDPAWRTMMETWLNNAANESAEAANGLDHIPNTADAGENDGIWTVERYTQEDLENGFIPPGKGVGDIIPGSAEDIDGDGEQDGGSRLSDFDLPAALNWDYWGGGTPHPLGWGQGRTIDYPMLYNDAGGDALDHIDALIYADHAVVANWGRNSPSIHLLGGIMTRLEGMIYRNDGSGEWIHDERFTGGGEDLGFVLPKVKRPIQILHWGEVPVDYTL